MSVDISQTWGAQGQYTPEILALNPQGIAARYAVPESPGGLDIVFDNAGHFYYGTLKFDIGQPDSGRVFFNQGKVPFQVLPDGGFMAKDRWAIYKLSSSGAVLEEIYRVPTHTNSITSAAYDPSNENLFISANMSNGRQGIWKIDVHTAEVLGTTHRDALFDISIANHGYLLANGDGGNRPILYDHDLNIIQEFPWEAAFVTQYVPEPSSLMLAGIGAVGWLATRRKKLLVLAGTS